jgi:hypothetical protein
MSFFRRVAALAASMAVAVAVIGVAGGGTASAATIGGYDWLCVFTPVTVYQICAYANESNPVTMTIPASTTTNWYFPSGGSSEIQQANTLNCMQVDHDNENKVIEAQCNNTVAYQLWTVVDDPGVADYFQWQSAYDKADCLSYNADAADLDIAPCGSTDWYQHFYAISAPFE